MRNEKTVKTMLILALVCIGMSMLFGLAAFSNALIIGSKNYNNVNSDSLDVRFVSENDSNLDLDETNVIPKIYSNDSSKIVSGTVATINNDNPVSPILSGIKATFNNVGQSVEYKLYAFNVGRNIAYRKYIKFDNLDNGDSYIKCNIVNKEITDEEASIINEVCKSISLTVTVGNDVATSFKEFNDSKLYAYNNVNTESDERFEPIIVKIEYPDSAINFYNDFEVEVGNITIKYSRLDE